MTHHRRLVATLLVCTVLSTSVGCTSMKTIRPRFPGGHETVFHELKPGDTVWVRTTTGRAALFVIQQVGADTLTSRDGQRYASADIAELKRRSFSAPRTAGLVGGILGGLFILIAAAAAAALGEIMSAGASTPR